MQHRTRAIACALGVSLALGGFSPTALASYPADPSDETPAGPLTRTVVSAAGTPAQSLEDLTLASAASLPLPTEQSAQASTASERLDRVATAHAARQAVELAADKTLAWDRSLIEAIGSQAGSGHSGCCPGYACAYGDAIVRGVANSHTMYGCGCCTWPNWGGGNSSYRDLGSDQAVLREAYENVKAGFPTVVHVRASYGQHWVTVVGYQNVESPDALSTDNFLCLDPWDGGLHVLSEQFALYGDNCQHVSDLTTVA